MVRRLVFLPFGLAAVLAAGCLEKEIAHTLYITPDGAVRWVAAERDVYSNEQEAGKRLAEEQGYIAAALMGSHPVALGLKALQPDMVSTNVVRDERPFHVVTIASFPRLDRVMERLFTENGIPATARLTSEGARTMLRVELDFSGGLVPRETPAEILLNELEAFRFVLTEGSIVAGGGFEVPDRSGRARISADWLECAEEAVEARRKIALVLAWE